MVQGSQFRFGLHIPYIIISVENLIYSQNEMFCKDLSSSECWTQNFNLMVCHIKRIGSNKKKRKSWHRHMWWHQTPIKPRIKKIKANQKKNNNRRMCGKGIRNCIWYFSSTFSKKQMKSRKKDEEFSSYVVESVTSTLYIGFES